MARGRKIDCDLGARGVDTNFPQLNPKLEHPFGTRLFDPDQPNVAR
jgi:hypothetical protein